MRRFGGKQANIRKKRNRNREIRFCTASLLDLLASLLFIYRRKGSASKLMTRNICGKMKEGQAK
jgi:hypothetical protein